MALVGDYIIFSSNPAAYPGVPYFELVVTSAGTQLAVHLAGVGNLTPALATLTPGNVHQLGVRYWWDGGAGEHHWEYIVDGIVEAGTGPTHSGEFDAVGLEVVAIGSDLGIAPIPVFGPSKRGKYDEILYWRAGNSITDPDIKDLYDSYFYYPYVNGWDDEAWGNLVVALSPDTAVNGWDDELWGVPTFAETVEIDTIPLVSCMPCGTLVSESPCPMTSCQNSC